ncbi:hypothetical protein ACLQ28_26305 [Micromonospora sp. DT201]
MSALIEPEASTYRTHRELEQALGQNVAIYWHVYAARAARHTNGSLSGRLTTPGERHLLVL